MSNLAVVNGSSIVEVQTSRELTRDQVELIKTTIAKGTTDDELALFMQVCNRSGLDPFQKQIYPVKRWSQKEGRDVMSIQVSIDGMRSIAESSGEYEGQTATYWCGNDGVWVDVWLQDIPPAAAKVGIYKRHFREPLWSVAKFSSYVQTDKNGSPTKFWKQMPELMIAKCVEALGLRKSFPSKLSKLYTSDEMRDSAESESLEHTVNAVEAPKPTKKTVSTVNRDRIAALLALTNHDPAKARSIRTAMFTAKRAIDSYTQDEMRQLQDALLIDWATQFNCWQHDSHRVNSYHKFVEGLDGVPTDEELFTLWKEECEIRVEGGAAVEVDSQDDGFPDVEAG